jgi:hypothetical protein
MMDPDVIAFRRAEACSIYNLTEAAAITGQSEEAIRAAIKDGLLEARKYGGFRYMIYAQDLRRFLNDLPRVGARGGHLDDCARS